MLSLILCHLNISKLWMIILKLAKVSKNTSKLYEGLCRMSRGDPVNHAKLFQYSTKAI